MLDWLKFFPFEWKVNHNPEEIRGPYRTKPRPHKWRLGDNTLYFYAPLSNRVFRFFSKSAPLNYLSPKRKDILKTSWDPVPFMSTKYTPSDWDCHLFYSDAWYFVGPWFTGKQARLGSSGILIEADKNQRFADKNLFHPRVFEAAVANVLDENYGYRSRGKTPMYRGPLHWKVLPISNSIHAICCDIHFIGNSSKENPHLEKQVFFPVSPTQFVRFAFDFGGVEIYREELCATALLTLCDQIISSLSLKVGANTQAEWDKVQATCPDMSLTETMGEFAWPIIEKKPSKKRKEYDITPEQDVIEPQLINKPEG